MTPPNLTLLAIKKDLERRGLLYANSVVVGRKKGFFGPLKELFAPYQPSDCAEVASGVAFPKRLTIKDSPESLPLDPVFQHG